MAIRAGMRYTAIKPNSLATSLNVSPNASPKASRASEAPPPAWAKNGGKLTFCIGPVLIFAILAGIALMVSLPLFFAQAGGGASEALEAFGEAFGDTLRLVASELGFLAVYLMPALVAILPIYVLRHKEKLTFMAFGCIYGLLLTYILFQIGFIDVMVQTFTSLYGSWASVPATVTTNVLSGFVLRMIDEWIASLKKPARKVRRRVKR